MSTRLRLSAALVPWFLALPAAAPLAPEPAAQVMKGDAHEDARFGFRVKPPKGWKAIPVPSDQLWVVAKFLSDKTYHSTEKGGWTSEFQPVMSVVAFVSPELKKAARKKAEKEEEEGEEGGEGTEAGKPEIVIEQPESDYRDYKDFLTKTYSGGGFYFSLEEPGEHEGLRVMRYEAKVEKMAYGGRKRIAAWVYSLPDVDVAVQIEVFEEDYEKLASLLDGVFKSLKPVARTGELPLEQGRVGGSFFFISLEELEELTPTERGMKRIQQQEEAHQKALAGLADGWHSAKIDRFLVVSCADEKFDKRVVEQAGAVLAWLDKTFPYVGPGEYVRQPIIRVCKNQEEENSFREHAGWWDGAGLGLEVTLNKEWGGTRSFEFEYVNGRMVDLWFNDHDRELWWAMPSWLQYGIRGLAEEATGKNGKLEFYRDDWTAEQLRELVREGRATEPKDLIHLSGEGFWGQSGASVFGRMKEAQALVDYLLLGPGAKGAKTKDLIKRYIANLEAVTSELEQAEKEKAEEGGSAPTTEEEEEKLLKAQREMWKQREQELLDEVGRRTFAGWSEADWKDLAKNYFKSI